MDNHGQHANETDRGEHWQQKTEQRVANELKNADRDALELKLAIEGDRGVCDESPHEATYHQGAQQ